MLEMTVNTDCQYFFYFSLHCTDFDLHSTLTTHCCHFLSLGFVLLICSSDRTRRHSLFSHLSLGPAHQVDLGRGAPDAFQSSSRRGERTARHDSTPLWATFPLSISNPREAIGTRGNVVVMRSFKTGGEEVIICGPFFKSDETNLRAASRR